MRIFLAIEIPQDIKERLVAVQEELKSQLPGVRWEKPEKLHITLVFLGGVEEERVSELEEAVREGVKGIKGFKVGLSGVMVFPNERRPRVVLVEVGEGREKLVELQKRLVEALSEAGFEYARLSKSHATLGRFRKGIVKEFGDFGEFEVGSFAVKEVVIMESKLHPAGAIHTPMARVPLC